MSLCISRALLDGILIDARSTPHLERCGLLLGKRDEISQFLPTANVAADPQQRFEIDPAALIDAYRTGRLGGPMVLGHYHYHPAGVPVPSIMDAASAHGDGQYWLIVTAHCWRLWIATVDGPVRGAFAPAELVLASV